LKIGWGVLKLPGTLRRLPRQLSAVAASLHALDPVPVEDALAAVDAAAAGAAGGRHGVDARLRWVREAAQTESIGFDDLAGWFDHHRPSVAQPVVCHGDLHPFNLLIDDNGVVTVLDWTNANISAREFDLGFTAGLLRCAPISTPGIVQPLVRRLTNWMANDFVRRYAETAPVDPVALNWFEALQYARCLAELASARSGLTHVVGPDHPFETAAPAMLARLAALTSITLTLPQRQPAPAS
jgi:aminoglycoside phosphotransferase (APT) family kinase protein